MLNPDSRRSDLALGGAALRAGDPERALGTLQRAANAAPEAFEIPLLMGLTHLQLGNVTAARRIAEGLPAIAADGPEPYWRDVLLREEFEAALRDR